MVAYHQLIFIFLISNLALWNIYPEKSEKTLLSIMWESVYEDKGILKEPFPFPALHYSTENAPPSPSLPSTLKSA